MAMLLLQVDHHSGSVLQMKWCLSEVMGSSFFPHHHHHHHHHSHTRYNTNFPGSCIQSPRCKYSAHQFIEMLDPQLPRLTTTEFTKPNPSLIRHVDHGSHQILGAKPATTTTDPITPVDTSLEQPYLFQNGDNFKASSFIDDQEVKMRRSYNMAPYLSVSQSSRRAAVRTSIQLVTRPSQMNGVKGIVGFYTWAFVAIAVGMATLFQRSILLNTSNGSTTVTCGRCYGYGVNICEICKGKGVVKWEGKLTHIDPCPLCFGSRTNKCYHCGGTRTRKDNPPFLQQGTKINMRRP